MQVPQQTQRPVADSLWQSVRDFFKNNDPGELLKAATGWQEHPFTIAFMQLLSDREAERASALLHPIVNEQHKTEHNKNFGVIETLVDVQQMCAGIVELCNEALMKEKRNG